MIKFRCSHCKKKFGVPDDYAGRRIRCNTCDHHTIVPNSAPGSIGAAATDQPCSIPMNIGTPGCAANSDWVAATDQREVDGGVSISPSEKVKPQPDSSDDELITAETLLNTPKSPDAEIQLQSFHHFTSSDSVLADPSPKPDPKNTVSELLKRCRPDPRTDRMELALNTLSFISCIGPIIFIILFIVFLSGAAGGISDSTGAIHDPNSSVADPNTVSAPNPFKFLPPIIPVRYAFFAFSLAISPLALIASMVIVLRYSYDMPKTLYFSIIIHGLIFFSIFQG